MVWKSDVPYTRRSPRELSGPDADGKGGGGKDRRSEIQDPAQNRQVSRSEVASGDQERSRGRCEASVRFAIDKTPPVISVAGVSDGLVSPVAVVVSFAATDTHLASVGATLDGAAFESGATVAAEGAHALTFEATDAQLDGVTALLDGAPFASGTPVTAEGNIVDVRHAFNASHHSWSS